MNRGRQQGFSTSGYTIVETLIFLAVSTAIFVTAVVLIGGQQSRAQFQSSVRVFETKIVDMANDVATGYYRSTGATKGCVEGANGPEFTGVDTPLGMNQNCVFIGTVLKLGDGGGIGDDEDFTQITMTGLRSPGGENAANLLQAKPKVLDNGTGFETRPIGSGVRVECVSIDNGPCTGENAAIGFFTTFEGSNLTGEGGAAVQANVISYGSVVTIQNTAAEARTAIDGFNYSSPALNRQITICLRGDTNQYALLRLGGNASSTLVVTTEIKGGTSCA